jgi:hypothetical protein
MTAAAGGSPTWEDFLKAKACASAAAGGNTRAALGTVQQIRESGVDNELLSCLDHYFTARALTQAGLPKAVTDLAYTVRWSLKAIRIPVPKDTDLPVSPSTLLQIEAAYQGSTDGAAELDIYPRPD